MCHFDSYECMYTNKFTSCILQFKKKINSDIWPSVTGICCCLTRNTSEVSCGPCPLELLSIRFVEKNERRPYGTLNERYATTAPAINTTNRRDGKYILSGQYFLFQKSYRVVTWKMFDENFVHFPMFFLTFLNRKFTM